MTEPTASTTTAAQLERIAEIRRRRAATNPPPASSDLPSPPVGTAPASAMPAPTLGSRKQRIDAVLSRSNHKRKRRHVAQGSRIVAAGLGATTMFGIVTAFGLNNNPTGQATAPPSVGPATASPAPAAAPMQVVVHRIPAATRPAVDQTDGAATTTAANTPIQLTANPVVQTITVTASAQPSQQPSAPAAAPTPAATTSGSS